MTHKKMLKSELNDEDKRLVEEASRATQLSYSPYSNLNVGTAMLLSNGETVVGANIENASYPLCICAERTALYNAKINHQKERIVKVAITAKHQEKTIDDCVSPCGACRQVLLEQETNQNTKIEVILTSEDIDFVIKIDSWSEFLPLSFGKDMLLKE